MTYLVFNKPGPVWLFPPLLILYPLREKIGGFVGKLTKKKNIKYVISGLFVGLIIEILAIINSMKLAPEQRALFHPEPITDLIFGAGYYILLMTGSYLIAKRYNFSLKQFFVLGGIFGLLLEQHGEVLLQVLGGNILGGIYVFLSYGALLAFPYMFFESDFGKSDKKRKKLGFFGYVLSFLILAGFYLLFLVYYSVIGIFFS